MSVIRLEESCIKPPFRSISTKGVKMMYIDSPPVSDEEREQAQVKIWTGRQSLMPKIPICQM